MDSDTTLVVRLILVPIDPQALAHADPHAKPHAEAITDNPYAGPHGLPTVPTPLTVTLLTCVILTRISPTSSG